ncbi:MAG: twin-arginine translocation signal domain-containing protein [Pirellulaceae bacterium]
MRKKVNRRRFIEHAAAIGGAVGLPGVGASESVASEPEPLKPVGDPKGIHPGRVVWARDPQVTDWQGPG